MNLRSSPPWASFDPRGSFHHSNRVVAGARLLGLLLVGSACLLAVSSLAAAQANTAETPDAPQAVSSSQPAPSGSGAQSPAQTSPANAEGQQTKRILGIIPNFRAVSTDEKLPRETVKEKFMDATRDSFDYSSILIPGIIAGYSMADKQYPEFHQGAAGYARYFWHSAVDQTSENYWVEFIVPTVTREDTRYYTLGRGGFFKRTGYALSRAVITRSDAGGETFNVGEIVGAGIAAGVSNLYYPSRERSFSNTGQQWAVDVGIDAASFVGREFWPDINRKLFHGRQ
jgi:hypothetical protein